MSISHAQGQLLIQSRPGSTSVTQLFTTDQLGMEITLVTACLISGAAAAVDVELYHDDDGTTYDANSIIATMSAAKNGTSILFQAQHPGSGIMIRPGGSLGCRISVANDVNFSVYGVSATLAERVRGFE